MSWRLVVPSYGEKINTTGIYNRRRLDHRLHWEGDEITISAMRDLFPHHTQTVRIVWL